jgi:hypothetical protein
MDTIRISAGAENSSRDEDLKEMQEMMLNSHASVLLSIRAKESDDHITTEVNGIVFRNGEMEGGADYDETMLAALSALTSMCLETVGPQETLQALTECIEKYGKQYYPNTAAPAPSTTH